MLFAFVRVFSVESSKSRIKRTVSNVAVEEPFRNVTSLEQISLESLNLSIIFTTTGCRKWNEDTKGWTMEDCTVNLQDGLQFSFGSGQAKQPRYH